ncbi:MAG: hypothetical protein LBR52_01870 [Prevotellaceae bacterium]|nr:hypothetical protein [Prevotellaceae bacterium]
MFFTLFTVSGLFANEEGVNGEASVDASLEEEDQKARRKREKEEEKVRKYREKEEERIRKLLEKEAAEEARMNAENEKAKENEEKEASYNDDDLVTAADKEREKREKEEQKERERQEKEAQKERERLEKEERKMLERKEKEEQKARENREKEEERVRKLLEKEAAEEAKANAGKEQEIERIPEANEQEEEVLYNDDELVTAADKEREKREKEEQKAREKLEKQELKEREKLAKEEEKARKKQEKEEEKERRKREKEGLEAESENPQENAVADPEKEEEALYSDDDIDMRSEKEIRKEQRKKEKERKKREKEKEKERKKRIKEREKGGGEWTEEDDRLFDEEFALEEPSILNADSLEMAELQEKFAEEDEKERRKQEEEDLKNAQKGKDGKKLLKIKVPNCYYINSVIYKREDFQFTYEHQFFVHYFEHRFHNKKKLYNIGDTSRIVAKHIMNLVGNTIYRQTDFNEVIDSIGVLMGYSVAPLLDSIMKELNLEYLAAGEIKIKHKKRNQTRIYAKIQASDVENQSLGNVTFYTRNKKTVIEELDASQFDQYLPPPPEEKEEEGFSLETGTLSTGSALNGDGAQDEKTSESGADEIAPEKEPDSQEENSTPLQLAPEEPAVAPDAADTEEVTE